jgi:hypothetical protein
MPGSSRAGAGTSRAPSVHLTGLNSRQTAGSRTVGAHGGDVVAVSFPCAAARGRTARRRVHPPQAPLGRGQAVVDQRDDRAGGLAGAAGVLVGLEGQVSTCGRRPGEASGDPAGTARAAGRRPPAASASAREAGVFSRDVHRRDDEPTASRVHRATHYFAPLIFPLLPGQRGRPRGTATGRAGRGAERRVERRARPDRAGRGRRGVDGPGLPDVADQ